MRWSSPDEVVRMNDHLISRLLRLMLMLLNRFQLMLARVVLHLAANVGVDARVVLIHFVFFATRMCPGCLAWLRDDSLPLARENCVRHNVNSHELVDHTTVSQRKNVVASRQPPTPNKCRLTPTQFTSLCRTANTRKEKNVDSTRIEKIQKRMRWSRDERKRSSSSTITSTDLLDGWFRSGPVGSPLLPSRSQSGGV